MKAKLKHRLIGIVIIIALVVIIVPSLLDGQKQSNKEHALVSIPLAPDQTAMDDDNDNAADNINQSLPSEPDDFIAKHMKQSANNQGDVATSNVANANPEDDSTVNEADEKAPSAQGFIIQLASLTRAKKIEELIALLHVSNYPAYSIPSKPVDGQLTRLLVGPFSSQQQAESVLSELKKLTGLDGKIRSFDVNED